MHAWLGSKWNSDLKKYCLLSFKGVTTYQPCQCPSHCVNNTLTITILHLKVGDLYEHWINTCVLIRGKVSDVLCAASRFTVIIYKNFKWQFVVWWIWHGHIDIFSYYSIFVYFLLFNSYVVTLDQQFSVSPFCCYPQGSNVIFLY